MLTSLRLLSSQTQGSQLLWCCERWVAGTLTVQVLDSQHIAVTKVLALTDPMRMAPRDLFDLNVLLEAGVDDPGPLLAQMPDAKQRLPLIMVELWPKIEAMSYEQFRNEVVPYLPVKVGQAIDREAFDAMRVDVGVAVEQWLQTAATVPPGLGS